MLRLLLFLLASGMCAEDSTWPLPAVFEGTVDGTVTTHVPVETLRESLTFIPDRLYFDLKDGPSLRQRQLVSTESPFISKTQGFNWERHIARKRGPKSLYGSYWYQNIGRVPCAVVMQSIRDGLREAESSKQVAKVFSSGVVASFDHCPELARACAAHAMLASQKERSFFSAAYAYSLLDAVINTGLEQLEFQDPFVQDLVIGLGDFDVFDSSEIGDDTSVTALYQKKFDQEFHNSRYWEKYTSILDDLNIVLAAEEGGFPIKRPPADFLDDLADITGHSSALLIDMVFRYLQAGDAPQYSLRPQLLIYLAAHARRVYGYRATFPILVYAAYSAGISPLNGAGMYHDRFNGMEAPLYMTWYKNELVKEDPRYGDSEEGRLSRELQGALFEYGYGVISNEENYAFGATDDHKFMFLEMYITYLYGIDFVRAHEYMRACFKRPESYPHGFVLKMRALSIDHALSVRDYQAVEDICREMMESDFERAKNGWYAASIMQDVAMEEEDLYYLQVASAFLSRLSADNSVEDQAAIVDLLEWQAKWRAILTKEPSLR